MNKIQAKRLLNVAKALRESKHPERFAMDQFVHTDWNYNATPTDDNNWCGSPACALGHYAARTDLQRVIKIAKANRHAATDPKLIFLNGKEFWWTPAEYGSKNISPINVHFGLSPYEMDLLFDSDGCGQAKSTRAAALYIERFVARKLKEAKR
jgi:hypothetical protein